VGKVMFDGVFNDLIKEKPSNHNEIGEIKVINNDKTPVQKIKQGNNSLDPRPDLTHDSILWWQMLAGAQYRDPTGELYAALHYMRTKGTVLRRIQSKDGKYVWVLRPYFDATGEKGWANIQEWEKEKHVLDPVRDRLISLLKDM
jgi:hypothetical protein